MASATNKKYNSYELLRGRKDTTKEEYRMENVKKRRRHSHDFNDHLIKIPDVVYNLFFAGV